MVDSVGWLCPVLMNVIMLAQGLWPKNINWNESVGSINYTVWRETGASLLHVEHSRIPRRLNFSSNENI